MKKCSGCKIEKPTSEFCRDGNKADGLRIYCRPCMSRIDKDVKTRQFGISPAEREEMLARQGGCCAICGLPQKDAQRLAIDHDHRCCPPRRACKQCVRGLLCGNCNAGLGKFQDRPVLLMAAAAYLKEYM